MLKNSTAKEKEDDDDESKPDEWEMRRFKVLKMQIYINSADDSIILLFAHPSPFTKKKKVVKFKRYLAL